MELQFSSSYKPWEAEIYDNAKGNTRLCNVFGFEEEIGSVYSHDIIGYKTEPTGPWFAVEHTDAQIKLREEVKTLLR